MTIQNLYLTEVAKLINGESADLPSHIGFSNQDGSITTSSTSLTNEIGSRGLVSTTRTGTEVTYVGTRAAGDVVDTTNGDTLEEIGYFNDSSGSNMQFFIDLAPITHTTNFDVEVSFQVKIQRNI